jgi:hypothetical protein
VNLGVLWPCRHAGEHLPPAAPHAPRPTACRPRHRAPSSPRPRPSRHARQVPPGGARRSLWCVEGQQPEIQVLDQLNTRLIQVLANLDQGLWLDRCSNNPLKFAVRFAASLDKAT